MNIIVEKFIIEVIEKLFKSWGFRLLEIGVGIGGIISYILFYLNF